MFGAVVSSGGLGWALVQLLIAVVVVWAVILFLDWVGVPEPFRKIVKVIIALFALIFIINLLLGLGGRAFWVY